MKCKCGYDDEKPIGIKINNETLELNENGLRMTAHNQLCKETK